MATSASAPDQSAVGRARAEAALRHATAALLEEIGADGYWCGELSSSALSTATALIALSNLSQAETRPEDRKLVAGGVAWLAANQNADGGWGDTPLSRSNISTTALVWAAFAATRVETNHGPCMERCTGWLKAACGRSDAGWERHLARAIRERYGKDHTFSVPILMACTLAGRMGPEGWRQIPALPFELAAVPHQFYGAIRLPVVSYALPALIAIGRLLHHKAPASNPLLRWIRNALRDKTARILETVQPANGGFLEATPLTSFVLMSLAATGEAGCLVARRAASFLRSSARADGSWPIDTNLATWVTTLGINALGRQSGIFTYEQASTLKEWLLGQQYRSIHPYTHAAPGGWAWTDLPGGVPDADDTPGALLALLALGPVDARVRAAGELGTRWLLGLQNKDGGIPTFCRGWGTLPFDRSGEDLTAHALRAWSAWLPQWNGALRAQVMRAIHRAVAFLEKRQRPDGSWVPLWFGNEHSPSEENPTWGTSRVLLALRELQHRGFPVSAETIARGRDALAAMQQPDGGWSGSGVRGLPCSIEETGMALEALAGTEKNGEVDRGTRWLVERVERNEWKRPSAVGFYFARLWYFEKLYPQLATVAGLGAAVRHLPPDAE
jgi:squalene-hopene/tetraprenyl-beta-curcumene cyclase